MPILPSLLSAWSLCFSTHIGSCSDFALTTTPTLDAFGGRTGTQIDVLVRHHQGEGVVSGLQDFAFYFTPAGTSVSARALRVTAAAQFGAPTAPPLGWTVQGSSDVRTPFDLGANFLSFQNPVFDQFIGGCQGGAFDGFFQSPLATCGQGAYAFVAQTTAQFDADAVTYLAVDVYAGDGNADFLSDQATCQAPVDGTTSAGFDLGDFSGGDVCRVSPLATTTAPEPATLGLVALGLAAVSVGGVRRGRASHRGRRFSAAGAP
jgi:PEP-CTERM motif